MISLSIAGSVFQNKAVHNVQIILPDQNSVTVKDAVTGTFGPFIKSLSPSEKTRVVEGIARAISEVYIYTIVAGAVVVILACCLPVSLHKNRLM